MKFAAWRPHCGIDDDNVAFGQFIAIAYRDDGLTGD
jgi:hypothetical protein